MDALFERFTTFELLLIAVIALSTLFFLARKSAKIMFYAIVGSLIFGVYLVSAILFEDIPLPNNLVVMVGGATVIVYLGFMIPSTFVLGLFRWSVLVTLPLALIVHLARNSILKSDNIVELQASAEATASENSVVLVALLGVFVVASIFFFSRRRSENITRNYNESKVDELRHKIDETRNDTRLHEVRQIETRERFDRNSNDYPTTVPSRSIKAIVETTVTVYDKPQGKTLGKANSGKTIQLIGRTLDGKWVHVKFKTEAWILASYLEIYGDIGALPIAQSVR